MNRFLSFLIRLYPERVRREHGVEMRQLLGDMERDEGRVRFFTAYRLAWDTLRMLPAAHVHELTAGPKLITAQGVLEAGFVTLRWIAFIGVGLLLLAIAAFSTIEAYVPFAPYIDTKLAPGFTWEAYEKVKPGMAADDVITILGNPRVFVGMISGDFLVESGGRMVHTKCWAYSEDGAFPYWDFAWMEIKVCFDEHDIVVTKLESVMFD